MKKNKRFEVLHEEKTSMMGNISILRDRKTGVQYLSNFYGGYPGGLTALLDQNGKPLIDDELVSDDEPVVDLRTN